MTQLEDKTPEAAFRTTVGVLADGFREAYRASLMEIWSHTDGRRLGVHLWLGQVIHAVDMADWRLMPESLVRAMYDSKPELVEWANQHRAEFTRESGPYRNEAGFAVPA